jgi:hypothetical protein
MGAVHSLVLEDAPTGGRTISLLVFTTAHFRLLSASTLALLAVLAQVAVPLLVPLVPAKPEAMSAESSCVPPAFYSEVLALSRLGERRWTWYGTKLSRIRSASDPPLVRP